MSKKYIASFSGGKDSTAMLIHILRNDYPLDEVIFVDTGIEFPQMYEHIEKVEQKLGIKITRLKPKITFYEGLFTPTKCSPRPIWGFPKFGYFWCKGLLKGEPLQNYFSSLSKHADEIVVYIGISYDEAKRENKSLNFKNPIKNKKLICPLIELRQTQEDNLRLCKSFGFNWGGLYDILYRVSCKFCPFKRISEYYNIFLYMPAIWRELLELEERVVQAGGGVFRSDYSAYELDQKFRGKSKLKEAILLLIERESP